MKTKYASFNYIPEISLTTQDAEAMSHAGKCDSDVLACMKKPYIRKQLKALPVDKLATELSEYGAWDADELQNHKDNLMRILWIAAGNISDGNC